MNTEMRKYRLCVSECFFQVSKICQRIYAERTRCEPSLSSVVQFRIRKVQKILGREVSTLRDHLRVIPTAGNITIDLSLPPATADLLTRARADFSVMMGTDLTLGDTISLFLFDYVVEDKADLFIAMLGIETLQ